MIQKSIDKIQEDGLLSYAFAVARYSKMAIEGRAQYLYYTSKYGSSAPNPFDTITINPNIISYVTIPAFSFTRSHHKTHILDGDWDQQHSNDDLGIHRGNKDSRRLIRVENYAFYNSLKRHFEQGVPWENTEFYRWAVDDARKNDIGGHYSTMEEIRSRLEEIDNMYESIRNHGYLSQQELGHTLPAVNEVQVNIGREGEILFDEGKHRFVISRILGLSEIPVRVFVRHKQWQQIRQEIATATNPDQLSDVAKQNLAHPDIQDINADLESE